MAEKRYYWLKLKADFFDEKYIKALRKLPQGDSLTIVYLKMQLKSLKTEGIIKYESFLPDSISELAMALDEDENVVKLAVSALVGFGVVEQWENDTLYMVAMQELVGSEGQSAERVRRYRENKALQCNTPVTSCNQELDVKLNKKLDEESVRENRFTSAPSELTVEFLYSRYGKDKVEQYASKAKSWMKRNNIKGEPTLAMIYKWLEEDKASLNQTYISQNNHSSIDIDQVEKAAYARYQKKTNEHDNATT